MKMLRKNVVRITGQEARSSLAAAALLLRKALEGFCTLYGPKHGLEELRKRRESSSGRYGLTKYMALILHSNHFYSRAPQDMPLVL